MAADGVLFKKVVVVGLGLIGSSLTRGLTEKGLAEEVVGFDACEIVRAKARGVEIGARVVDEPTEDLSQADLVVLAVPVGAMKVVAQSVCLHLKKGAVLTDVGSVKKSIIADILPLMPEGTFFVPGHPVAGTEFSGPEAGMAGLFEGRWCILTPVEETPDEVIQCVKALWQGLGSFVECMDPDHHDIVLAITSHIPHLIAYNIVGTAADLEEVTKGEVIKYSAGGFRDFTRIAASDPVMWRDVFMCNKEAVLEMLGRFVEDLTQLQRHIRRDDSEALEDLFTRTRAIRRSIVEAGQETDKPDFGR